MPVFIFFSTAKLGQKVQPAKHFGGLKGGQPDILQKSV